MGDLTGLTIGVTAERRAEEFISALERNGATVRHAPMIHIVPLPDDRRLRAATEDVLAEDIDMLAVTTGAGFRGWLDAVEGWGRSDRLLATLRRARIFTRGPKGRGAVRGRGLSEEWSAPEESNRQLFAHLLETGVAGKRVAVQLHGSPLREHTAALADAGARLIELQPYRWEWPSDMEPAYRLLDGVLDRRVQALAFTSAPATANLLDLARQRGSYEDLLRALQSDVVCACVGPVTAAPLTAVGVPTLQPERQRLGALVKLLVSELGG
ncbi:uroporphyrinogen-III synthase [Amycolatopsis alkalitolerans]|uniref:Uroporphyrinogen-III synthase n=1 Tax=Amycolatopsis alkalitolerans TaxID=2547244 RepID=A0A5C4M0M2_9PSEU|nr:uroporphyrinogen-III synthase [Amycolatopsis alkalitolerans]TNC23174.1 uroporphyrinogen-III synthase [Amycolatopsis alkalitolerans]